MFEHNFDDYLHSDKLRIWGLPQKEMAKAATRYHICKKWFFLTFREVKTLVTKAKNMKIDSKWFDHILAEI